MTDILDKFIGAAKQNVKSGYYDSAGKFAAKVKKVSLKEKLQSQNFCLIAEIKHASPAGDYSFDFIDAEKAALSFKEAGADAVSVVAEPQIFKGRLDNIPSAKKSGLPVLFKDIVISEQQIRAAASLGADCVLLIMKAAHRLGFDANKFICEAHSLGLEVLLECYDEKEMLEAMKTDADILGINNRDLGTLAADLNRTKDILLAVKGADSKNRPVISESGVREKKDAEFVRMAGAKGILVGTALWKATDQQAKIRELKEA